MGAAQLLYCLGGDHNWSRASATGRPPSHCPEHPAPSRQRPNQTEYQRTWYHEGSEVTAAEVVQWVGSLGLEVSPSLKGRVADILVARYNREHPDRPYVRVRKQAVR